jgi:hypothetical protein
MPTVNLTNYQSMELLLANIPRDDTRIKHVLRAAYPFMPMPLTIGWNPSFTPTEYPKDCKVNGLVLTDIDSGATRPVHAPWMHALYKESKKVYGYSTVFVKLREVNFGSQELTCLALLGILFSQIGATHYAFTSGHTRDAFMLAAGISLQVMDGFLSHCFPKYKPPRRFGPQRSYSLHTGMTTSHILVLQHHPSGLGSEKSYINLEDAATPWDQVHGPLEKLLKMALFLANWVYHLSFVLFPSDSLLLPIVLIWGTLATEAVGQVMKGLPLHEAERLPKKGQGIYLLLTEACKRTGKISVGFIESILPDREGTHKNFRKLLEELPEGGSKLG